MDNVVSAWRLDRGYVEFMTGGDDDYLKWNDADEIWESHVVMPHFGKHAVEEEEFGWVVSVCGGETRKTGEKERFDENLREWHLFHVYNELMEHNCHKMSRNTKGRNDLWYGSVYLFICPLFFADSLLEPTNSQINDITMRLKSVQWFSNNKNIQ